MRGLRSFGLLALYVGAQVAALALALPFKAEGLTSSSNPNSPTAPLVIIIAIVVAPLVILWGARRRGGLPTLRWVILVGIAGSLLLTLYYTFLLFLPVVYLPPTGVGQVFDPSAILASAVAVSFLLALLIEPQWYVIDTVGFLAAGALIALLGISFGILPVLILLTALAGYDAIAVYRTKHMVSLADAVTEMRLPILMVMPSSTGYDFTQAPSLKQQRGVPVEEREATFMGLGDVVIPGTLVVSAFVWLPSHPGLAGVGGNLWVAIAALVGSLVGYAFLMRQALSGNPQAGLPFLNGGAIAGYLFAFLAVYHSLGFGISLNF
jgi:presenilin-like A22 family membrane protease